MTRAYHCLAMSFVWSSTAFDLSSSRVNTFRPVEMRSRMRLLVLSILFISFVGASCRSRETNTNSSTTIMTSQAGKESGSERSPHQPCLNLNAATAEELIKLPGVGEVMAKRIVDYRERRGRLRRPEEIIIIEGFSDRKYRAIAALVCVD